MVGIQAVIQVSAGRQKCQNYRLQASINRQWAEFAPAEVIMLQLECENVIFLWISTLAPTDCLHHPRIPPLLLREPELRDPKLFRRDSRRTCIITGHQRDAPLEPLNPGRVRRWQTPAADRRCAPTAGLHRAPPPTSSSSSSSNPPSGITPQVSVCFPHRVKVNKPRWRLPASAGKRGGVGGGGGGGGRWGAATIVWWCRHE